MDEEGLKESIRAIVVAQKKIKEISEKMKEKKKKLEKHKEATQVYMTENDMTSLDCGVCILNVKERHTKPSLSYDYLTMKLGDYCSSNDINPDHAAKFAEYIKQEREKEKTTKEFLSITKPKPVPKKKRKKKDEAASGSETTAKKAKIQSVGSRQEVVEEIL